jgi:hypothetical protein
LTLPLLAPVNVKQSKLLLCLDPSNTSDTICCESICILIWSYLILMYILYPVVYCLVWSISQVPWLGYVCTVRQYWSNSLYQGRYTRKSLWLSLASVGQYSTQYNYKNYLWGDVCGSLYVYFNVKCLYSVYCFLVTILFMDFKPIKYFMISDFCTCTNSSFGFFSSLFLINFICSSIRLTQLILLQRNFFGPRYIGDDFFLGPRYIGDNFF